MFCTKCGANIPDGEANCPSCGQPVESTVPVANNEQQPLNQFPVNPTVQEPLNNTPMYNAPMGNGFMNNAPADNAPMNNAPMEQAFSGFPTATGVENPNKGSNKTKLVVFIAIAAAAVILIVVLAVFLLKGCSGSGSYRDALDKAVMLDKTGNVDTYMELMPDDVIQYQLEEYYDEDIDEMKNNLFDNLELQIEYNKDKYGNDYTVNYEIRKEQFCTSKGDLTDLTDKFQERYNSDAKITSAAKIKVKERFEGPDDKDTHTVEYYFIQIDGKWYIDPSNLCLSVGIDFE